MLGLPRPFALAKAYCWRRIASGFGHCVMDCCKTVGKEDETLRVKAAGTGFLLL